MNKILQYLIDVSSTPHVYRLDNDTNGAVSIDPDTKIATITYCSFYHTGVIFKLVYIDYFSRQQGN